MLNASSLWEVISPLVSEEGAELFDIECSKGSKILKVFIQKGDGNVGVEDCARVSRRITDHPLVEEILPGETILEVSSPGINRKLRRPEHFQGALGERVRLKVRGGLGDGSRVLRGVLTSCNGARLALDAESGVKEEFELEDVSEANVEFRF